MRKAIGKEYWHHDSNITVYDTHEDHQTTTALITD